LYNAIKFPHEMATIYPISDLHYWHHAFDDWKFKEYISKISNDPSALVILDGDLVDNALFDSVWGSIYESSKNPDAQIDWIVKLLMPISGKIIASVCWNHEIRTSKKAGIDISAWIAEKLQVPYRKDLMFLDILLGGKRFSFYIWHWASNSMTAGGKLNAAMRPNNHTWFINFYVSWHVHDPIVKPFETFHPNPETLKVEQRTGWIVINWAMMKYFNTYGSEKSWQPPSPNFVKMQCYDSWDYNAWFLN
jgi:hypothetical protein